ncbi:MAG: STAS domain-containing protein [Deltaproteobacteria bacterium]|nr:STAS domain-containing protein [Deltaproteobacteria bacterium]
MIMEKEETMERVILCPDFDIVASRVGEIRDAVLNVAGRSRRVVLDLSRTSIIDSMGIGVIVACLKTLKQQGGDLVIENAKQDIIKLFKLLKLDFIIGPVGKG